MQTTIKKILFSICTLFCFALIIESILFFLIDNKIEHNIHIIDKFDSQAWIHFRDQHLPNPFFIDTTKKIWQTHPKYEKRGMPFTTISTHKKRTRLLALGGSTTVGIPFEKEVGGFPRRLEEMSKEHATANKPTNILPFKVINAAVPGMASTSFSQMISQIPELEIDGVLIYTGNNEHPATMYSFCLQQQQYDNKLSGMLQKSNTYRFLFSLFQRTPQITLQEAIQSQDDCLLQVAREVHRKQPNTLTDKRSDILRSTAKRNLQQNISNAITQYPQIPFFIAIPPINYQVPPKRSFISPQKSNIDPNTISEHINMLETLWNKRMYGKVRQLASQLQQEYPEYALFNYFLGIAEIKVGQEELGTKHVQLALEQDWQPERITPDLQNILRETCSLYDNAYCVDINVLFEEYISKHGFFTESLFVDYCHPSKTIGTDIIAKAYLDILLRHDFGIKDNHQSQ